MGTMTTVSTTTTTTTTGNKCSVCEKECIPPLRCSQCKMVVYCSRQCQKRHWKQIHKSQCKAISAAHELKSYLSNMTMEEAHQQFGKATEKFQQEKQIEKVKTTPPQKVESLKQKKKIHPTTTKIQTTTKPPIVPTMSIKNPNYIGIVEVLPNIQCYHVFLKKENKNHHSSNNNDDDEITTLNQLKLFIDYHHHNNNNSNNVVSWTHIRLDLLTSNTTTIGYESNCLMKLKLPSMITKNDVRISIEDGNSICLRLPYTTTVVSNHNFFAAGDDVDLPISLQKSPPTKLMDINYVRCKFCHQYLLYPHHPPNKIPPIDDHKIHKIFPLPTGFWDDILDYLTCYEGVSTHYHYFRLECIQHTKIISKQKFNGTIQLHLTLRLFCNSFSFYLCSNNQLIFHPMPLLPNPNMYMKMIQ